MEKNNNSKYILLEICCGETAPLLYISPVLYPLAIEI
jgi:hypothetical protein